MMQCWCRSGMSVVPLERVPRGSPLLPPACRLRSLLLSRDTCCRPEEGNGPDSSALRLEAGRHINRIGTDLNSYGHVVGTKFRSANRLLIDSCSELRVSGGRDRRRSGDLTLFRYEVMAKAGLR